MPLLWLSIAFLGGLLLGSALPPLWPFLAAAGGGLLLAAWFERRVLTRFAWYRPWRDFSRLPLALGLAAACLGAVRFQVTQGPLTENDLAWYNGRGEYQLEGVIQQPPEASDTSLRLVVSVESLVPLAGGQAPGNRIAVRGWAAAYLPPGQDWRYGDRIQLSGSPEEPQIEGAPYYHDSLARQGIDTTLSFASARLLKHDQGSWFLSAVYDFRALADRTIARLLPQPESALLAGILLGDDRALPQSVSDAFRAAGITHILAVSGFNVAIISGLFVRLLGRLLRARFAIPLALLAVAGYTLLTGATPSVVRAALMGGIAMLGPVLGRRQVGINSLAFTAGVMCLFNPALPGDLSFQLSFGAVLGLVLFAEPLQQGFLRLAERFLPAPAARRISGPVAEFFLFTLAAQVFTLPITALNFQRISLSALLANPLVLPVQPYAMLLGGAALLLGMVFLPLGQLAAWLCWPLLAFTIHVAEWLAQFQYSLLYVGTLSAPLVVIYFAGLIALAVRRAPAGVLLQSVRQRLRGAFKPAVALGLTGLLAVGLWRGAFSAPDGRLHLDVLNLNGGPALLVRSPVGRSWLINGSADSAALADALGRRLQPFATRLDGLVVTAGSATTLLASLDNLTQKYTPAVCALSAQLNPTKTFQRIWDHLLAKGVSCASLEDLPTFDLGGGAVLFVLSEDQNGTALWFAAGGFHTLIPGGAPPGDIRLPAMGLSLLVLTPRDIQNMSPAVWTATFRPQAVLFSGGDPPLPGWIALDDYDWVSFQSDGRQFWVEGAKK